MRGQAMALCIAIAPIGAPIAAWIANHFGPRWSLAVGAASGFIAALAAACLLLRRKDSLPTPSSAA